MRSPVVVDANVLFAVLVRPTGWTAAECRRLEGRLFAPEWVWHELAAKDALIAEKRGCSRATVRHAITELRSIIHTVSTETFAPFSDHPDVARARILDAKDAAYVACLQATDAQFLWTRDKALHEAFPGVAVPLIPEE